LLQCRFLLQRIGVVDDTVAALEQIALIRGQVGGLA
jgi:hypothetical protein